MHWRALIPVLVILGALPAGGATQERQWAANGPFGGTVSQLEIDPKNPLTVYSGTIRAGLFKSVDGGRSWRRRSAGLPPDSYISLLEIAPSDPSTLYLQVNASTWMFVSTDGARSWKRVGRVAPSDPTVKDIEVHPRDPSTVLLATFDGLFRSSDGGATWGRLYGPYQPERVAIAPSAPNVIYADSNGWAYRSSDGGASWSRVRFPTLSFLAFEVDPHDANVFYASGLGEGLWRTTDGGATSTLIKREEPGYIEYLSVDRRNPRLLYTASRQAVYRSTNGGSTWTNVTPRRSRDDFRDLEVDSRRGERAYLGVERQGLFLTTNGGRRWRTANRGIAAAGIELVAEHPRAARVAYAGTVGVGLWRTRNGGRSWAPLGFRGHIVYGFAIDPTAPRRMYVAAHITGRTAAYRTDDSGRRWRTVLRSPRLGLGPVGVAPTAPHIVYASPSTSWNEVGIYRSADRGRAWKKTRLEPGVKVTCFAFHPRRGSVLWAGTAGQGVLRSKDGGRSWKAPGGRPVWGEIRTIAVDPSNPRVLYAAAIKGGVIRSTNGGRTWAPSNEGIPRNFFGPMPIYGIALDRRNPRVLYAAGYYSDQGGHVYRSTNRGRTWTDITGAMPNRESSFVALSRDGRILYVGTGGESGGAGVLTTRVK